jgi:adenylosuccinate lyase
MGLTKAGADRQAMHERLRQQALSAWQAVQAGQPNPLTTLICSDEVFRQYLEEKELYARMDVSRHLGDAPARARAFAEAIRQAIE